MSDIEAQLLEAARQSGLSMKALSDRSGIPYSAVHGFLKSDRRITLRYGAKLADVLGLGLRPIRRPRSKGR